MNTTDATAATISIDLSATSRRCGDCQLCCRLLPVMSLEKPHNTRCAHQRTGKGCTVYRTSQMPPECHVWSCRWLVDPAAAALRRPDRTHYVVDVIPDMIGVEMDGAKRDCMVVQVWVDPNYPDAHRDPVLRTYLAEIAARDRTPAIVRCGSMKAILLIAPCLHVLGRWVEEPVIMSGVMRNRFVDSLTGRRA